MQRGITIEHRQQGYGYLLIIEGVGETILMSAEDLLFLADWGIQHREELTREAKTEHDENARRLLDEMGD